MNNVKKNALFLHDGFPKLTNCTSVEAKISKQYISSKAKNSCLGPNTLIYGIFVANVVKNTAYAFRG